MTPRPTKKLAATALQLLRNCFAQGLDREASIAFTTSAMGQEHAALVRGVWRDMFECTGGAG